MPVIKFIEFDGTKHEVDADAGMSIMEVAMKYDVPGIDADCGGGAVCGTCHCFIEESAGPLPAVDPQEESMLGLRPQKPIRCSRRVAPCPQEDMIHSPGATSCGSIDSDFN